MNNHHLILGHLSDYLTGQSLDDTHDERHRQKLARHLVEHCSYAKNELTARFQLTVSACNRRAIIPVDFLVTLSGKVSMVIKYGPGSLVTRHNPAIAISRVLCPYKIPVAVVTNGEDAHIINCLTGNIMGKGLINIPSRRDLETLVQQHKFEAVPVKMVAMANQIIYAFEVDGSCPCDTDICRLP